MISQTYSYIRQTRSDNLLYFTTQSRQLQDEEEQLSHL